MIHDRPRRDYYAILALPRTATAQEIRAAFRQLARKHHPDVSAAPGAAARFRGIRDAYEVLSDPRQRREYDVRCDGQHPLELSQWLPAPMILRPILIQGVIELGVLGLVVGGAWLSDRHKGQRRRRRVGSPSWTRPRSRRRPTGTRR